MAAAFKGGTVDGAIFPVTTWRPGRGGGGRRTSSPGSATRRRGSWAACSPRPRRSPSAGRWSRNSSPATSAAPRPTTRRSASARTASWCRGRATTRCSASSPTAVKQPPARVASGLPFIDPEGRLDVGDIYKQVELWKGQGQVGARCRSQDLRRPHLREGPLQRAGLRLMSLGCAWSAGRLRGPGKICRLQSALQSAFAAHLAPADRPAPSTSSSSWPRAVSE